MTTIFSLSSLDGENGFQISGSGGESGLGYIVDTLDDFNGDGAPDLLLGTGGDAFRLSVLFGSGVGQVAETTRGEGLAQGGFEVRVSEEISGFIVDGASAGDVNGDGLTDFAFTLRKSEPGVGVLRSTVVVYGSLSDTLRQVDYSAGDAFNGFTIADSGERIASAGDVNGDGIDDLILSGVPNPYASPFDDVPSAAFVLYGSTGSRPATVDVSTAPGFYIHNDTRNGAMEVAAAGDVNDDGFDDVLVGDGEALNRAGAVYVVFGGPSGAAEDVAATASGDADLRIVDSGSGTRLGVGLSGVGDVNGDGVDDIAVVATPSITGTNSPQMRPAYVIFGRPGGWGDEIDLAALDPSVGVRFDGLRLQESDGVVAGVGDVNQDGLDDFLLGSPASNVQTNVEEQVVAGASYLVDGSRSFDGVTDLNDLGPGAGVRIDGLLPFDRGARAVAGGDDLDGDGVADLVIGSPGADPRGLLDATIGFSERGFNGAAYVLSGAAIGNAQSPADPRRVVDPADTPDARATFLSYADTRWFDGAGYTTGDFTGDGIDDLIIGLGDINGGRPNDILILPGTRGGWPSDMRVGPEMIGRGVLLEVADGVIGGLSEFPDSRFPLPSVAGDIDGDGFDDLLLIDRLAKPIIFFGGADQPGARVGLAAAEASGRALIVDPTGGDAVFSQVAPAGDFNGDGFDDLFVSRNVDGNREATVFLGGARGQLAAADFSDFSSELAIEIAAAPGNLAAIGDVNDDGFEDLLNAGISRGFADQFGTESEVIFGRATGSLGPETPPTLSFSSTDPNRERFLRPGDRIGDVNGDGVEDFMVQYEADTRPRSNFKVVVPGLSAPAGFEREGGVFVVYGDAGFGDTLDLAALDGANGFRISGWFDQRFRIGTTINAASAGDVNGDGIGDIYIDITLPDLDGDRKAAIVFGRTGRRAEEIDLRTLSPADGFFIDPPARNWLQDASEVAAGDFDGDGFGDLAIAGAASQVEIRPGPDFFQSGDVLLFGKAFPAPAGERIVDGAAEPWRYLASHADLEAAFGLDPNAAAAHWRSNGRREERDLSFDALAYIASHPDLMSALGADAERGAEHFLRNGRGEGRAISFDATSYLASNSDLIPLFANDLAAATAHFINAGFAEGRGFGFDGLAYIASHPDLTATFSLNAAAGAAHFVNKGFSEGRAITFEGLEYIASHGDLADAFGVNATLGASHFITNGRIEGRSISFNGLEYVASFADLADALGASATSGAAHFIKDGRFEGRSVFFDGLAYIASHNDLADAFGADADRGAAHFITDGRFEGRSISFDGVSYIAANDDLIGVFGPDASKGATHFITDGRLEGRATAFDGLRYIASHGDLIDAFGLDEDVATLHFITDGFREGRVPDRFDALQYIASHTDLIAAFGVNETIATQHFITDGFAEGRTPDDFNAAQYLANHADLQAAFEGDLDLVTQHYITNGFAEGRTDDIIG